MTNLNDTRTAAPTIALLRNRFAPWQMFSALPCGAADEDELDVEQADEDDVADFDAEDPRDLRVLDRLARLEAFTAA